MSDDVVSSSSAVAAATYAPTRGPISSVSADSTLADVRVMQMQHEIQLAKMNANMALQQLLEHGLENREIVLRPTRA